jgi:VWFA-related protein
MSEGNKGVLGMKASRVGCLAVLLVVGFGWLNWKMPAVTAQQVTGQPTDATSAQAAQASSTVIKAETRLVVVDTIVTDKHGNYVRDLTKKDFKVWEDDKEQTIKNFSYEADPNSPTNGQKHYMVLFFDNSTMEFTDQAQARKAAASFIDANSGPNRYMAILNYGGAVHVAQNFTTDPVRLKQVASGIKLPNVPSSDAVAQEVASLGAPPMFSSAEADYGSRTMLLALRSVAKNLAGVPGRKSLVLLTAGFPSTQEQISELTAVINACNKANVAVYPVDVRGLLSPVNAIPSSDMRIPAAVAPDGLLEADIDLMPQQSENRPRLIYVALPYPDPQVKGSGGQTGGKTGGTTGTGGKTGGTTGSAAPVRTTTQPIQNTQPQLIVPPFPPSATTNQQILFALAAGTGGFVIVNTNDLAGGLGKIANEQVEYYSLGYTPDVSAEGSCHTLKVKVERSGTVVRSRSGYCNVKPVDMLAGKPAAKELENRAAGTQAGNVAASILAPYFFTSSNIARVNLAMELPSGAIQFDKDKGKQHAVINVLGIASRPDGSVSGRFSDAVELNFETKDQLKEFLSKPYQYENQFELAAGQYKLTVVFSSGGQSFGKVEVPLLIEAHDGKQFSLSAVALSKEMRRYGAGDSTLDSELLQDRTPLVTQGLEVIPAASNHFKKSDPTAIYVEAYEPLLTGPNPPKIGLQIRIIDRKTGEKKIEAGVADTSASVKAGNPVVPLGLKLPTDRLAPGSYRVELVAVDSAGNHTKASSADFELE